MGGRARKGLIRPPPLAPPPVSPIPPYTLIYPIYQKYPHNKNAFWGTKYMNRRILTRELNISPTWQYYNTKSQPWRWLGGSAIQKSWTNKYICSVTCGPTWDPKMVISRAASRSPKWKFDTMLASMLPRAPHTQTNQEVYEIGGVGEDPPGEPYIPLREGMSTGVGAPYKSICFHFWPQHHA